MNDQWTDRLSDYLDGELNAAERAELEEHLSGCAECLAVLELLRQVVARAQGLEDRAPDSDLWSGVAERIRAAASVSDLDEHRRHNGWLVDNFSAKNHSLRGFENMPAFRY